MNIQKVSANYNYGSMNFKGTIHKSAIKQYQREVQKAFDYLSIKANDAGISVNELTEEQFDFTSGVVHRIEVSSLTRLKEKFSAIMDAVTDYMVKAHKDSKLIYVKPPHEIFSFDEGKFIYRNSKLDQEEILCIKNNGKNKFLRGDDKLVQEWGDKLDEALVGQDYDKKLETKALEKLEEKAKNTKTKLGLWLLKREGKKIEEFEHETGMEVTDTSRLIEETMYKAKWQKKLEKQNQEIIEKQNKAILER